MSRKKETWPAGQCSWLPASRSRQLQLCHSFGCTSAPSETTVSSQPSKEDHWQRNVMKHSACKLCNSQCLHWLPPGHSGTYKPISNKISNEQWRSFLKSHHDSEKKHLGRHFSSEFSFHFLILFESHQKPTGNYTNLLILRLSVGIHNLNSSSCSALRMQGSTNCISTRGHIWVWPWHVAEWLLKLASCVMWYLSILGWKQRMCLLKKVCLMICISFLAWLGNSVSEGFQLYLPW